MIEIHNPGLYSTIQDIGRKGYQNIGVPECGAMDKLSFRIANLLVGNPENTPSIEITLYGPELYFEVPTYIAITGADLSPYIDDTPINNWTTVLIKGGQTLKFYGPVGNGGRAYIAIGGGLNSDFIKEIMGSFSTYVPGEFGGYAGRQLKSGDSLLVNPYYKPKDMKVYNNAPVFIDKVMLNVILGPQEDFFDKLSITNFFESEYFVSTDSNRMGTRLHGDPLTHINGLDVISDGNAFGSVQVPVNGQPIILLADRGTTGGYAKLGTVITADHSKLAQMIPGNTVIFKKIGVNEAVDLLIEQECHVREIDKVELRNPLIKVGDSRIDVLDSDGKPIQIKESTHKKFNIEVVHKDTIDEIEVYID